MARKASTQGKKRASNMVPFFDGGKKKIPFRRWKSAVRTALREKYREEKKAQIELSNVVGKRTERTVITASILAQGAIVKRFNTCGKPKCHCSKGGKKHGPYWYLSLPMPAEMVRKGSPRIKQFYLDEAAAIELRARISNFKKLQKTVWRELYDELVVGGRFDIRVPEIVNSMG